jgi:hypothetical protein
MWVMVKYILTVLAVYLLPALRPLAAQDFMLLGCYWDCPDDASSEIDTATFRFWAGKVREQAPELRHSGFSHVWLPAFTPDQQAQIVRLTSALRNAGIESLFDVELPAEPDQGDTLHGPLADIHRLRQELQVRGFRLTSQREIRPALVGRLLRRLEKAGELPELFFIRTTERQNARRLAGFVNAIEQQAAAAGVLPDVDARVIDYPLRENLRRACADPDFDVRQIYSGSIRDVTSLSGYKIVTVVNSSEFYNPNGLAGDQDDLIRDPMLAYAYTLTNNQLGLPAVFYGDYFGPESEIEYFLDRPALRNEIDQLIKAHREYIFNSTAVEYLNRDGTDRGAHYYSGSPARTLIFQLDGANTPAGQAAGAAAGRDVLVAINFADTVLRVVQEVNVANLAPGDHFTDILGRAALPLATVGPDEETGIANSVYLEGRRQTADGQTGRRADGRRADGRRQTGRRAGRQTGRRADGRRADGRRADGRRADGQTGRRQTGRRQTGRRADGRRADGRRADGRRQTGRRADGRRADGRRADGRRQTGRRADGRRADGRRADGQTGRRQAGRRQAGRRQAGRRQTGRRQAADGRRQTADGRRQTADGRTGRRQTGRRADGQTAGGQTGRTAGRADGQTAGGQTAGGQTAGGQRRQTGRRQAADGTTIFAHRPGSGYYCKQKQP